MSETQPIRYFQQFTLYKASTGEIVGNASTTNSTANFNWSDGSVLSVVGTFNSTTQYVSGGVITARPTMGITVDKTSIAANDTDQATFSGIPSGVSASIDGGSPTTITDGTLELTAAHAATYTVEFTNFPMIPMTFSIVAS